VTRAEQRIADLEDQVAELAAEVRDLRIVRAVEDISLRYAFEAGATSRSDIVAPRRPRHLIVVAGGRS
jgi:hypothetical protein